MIEEVWVMQQLVVLTVSALQFYSIQDYPTLHPWFKLSELVCWLTYYQAGWPGTVD